MNGEFYASLLALSEMDREELLSLTMEDHFLDKVVEECAEGWWERRRHGCDPVAVRQLYLARTALVAARYGCTHKTSRSVAAAFALTLCKRIEQRVWEFAKAAEIACRERKEP